MNEVEYEMFQWPRLRGFKHASLSVAEKIDLGYLFLNILYVSWRKETCGSQEALPVQISGLFFFIIYFCSSLICIMHYDTRNQEGPYLHRLVFELPRRHGGGVCYLPIF